MTLGQTLTASRSRLVAALVALVALLIGGGKIILQPNGGEETVIAVPSATTTAQGINPELPATPWDRAPAHPAGHGRRRLG